MKRSLTRRLAASLFAAILALAFAVLPVSASFTYNGISYPDKRQYPNNLYATEDVFGNGNYWYPNIEAYYEFNTLVPSATKKPVHAYSSSNNYFDYLTGDYQSHNNLNSPYVYSITRFVSNKEGGGIAWRGTSGKFYPTNVMAKDAGITGIDIRKYENRGSGNYFNTATGRYYTSLADCVAATGSAYDVLINFEGQWYDRNYTETFRNSKANKTYLSEAEAKNAADGGTIIRGLTSTQGYFFNRGTGHFYLTEANAIAPTNAADVIRAMSFSYSNGILDSFGVQPGYYYGMPTIIPYPDAGNPEGTTPGGTTPSTQPISVSPYDENSTATLRSSAAYKGWLSIANLVDTISAGANMTIMLNQDTYVSSTFMRAVAGRDINVILINSNNSQIRFNGLDVYSPKDMPVSIAYRTASIPPAVYEKVLSTENPVSSSTFTVGTEVDLGAVVKVYVRFDSSRAGYDSCLYLYESSKNSASLVDSKTIDEDGLVIFEIRKGGQFIVCVDKK
ncbi:MAG: hypothetical protein LBL87_03490 [Ruminococcus sp.]|jgi:hypothetical protein|nr:hypothetical protein [Ruminococcus sp.]